jgi:CDP-diacylglycerol--glycerol-3-phosphate 3-phosphatidyltransferase
MAFDKQAIKDKSRRILDPVVAVLASTGVSPMLVSVIGLVISFCAAILITKGSLFWAGILLLISGICDVLDGALARERGKETRFGAFVDSTFDRIGELFIFGAILIYYNGLRYSDTLLVVILVAMGGSVLVSYARARIEGLGQTCTVGHLERPERLILLIVGLFLGRHLLVFVLTLMAFGTVVTVLQRIHHAHEVLSADPPKPNLKPGGGEEPPQFQASSGDEEPPPIS